MITGCGVRSGRVASAWCGPVRETTLPPLRRARVPEAPYCAVHNGDGAGVVEVGRVAPLQAFDASLAQVLCGSSKRQTLMRRSRVSASGTIGGPARTPGDEAMR